MKFKLDKIEKDRKIIQNILQVISDRYYMFNIRTDAIGIYTFYNSTFCNGQRFRRDELLHILNVYYDQTKKYLENEDGRIGFNFEISPEYLGYTEEQHNKFKKDFLLLFKKSRIYKDFDYSIERTNSYTLMHIVYKKQEDFLTKDK